MYMSRIETLETSLTLTFLSDNVSISTLHMPHPFLRIRWKDCGSKGGADGCGILRRRNHSTPTLHASANLASHTKCRFALQVCFSGFAAHPRCGLTSFSNASTEGMIPFPAVTVKRIGKDLRHHQFDLPGLHRPYATSPKDAKPAQNVRNRLGISPARPGLAGRRRCRGRRIHRRPTLP